MPGTDNIRGIAEMAPPTTVTKVRRFLGATGFYQRFIKGYAKIAKPLSDLLAGDNSKLKGERVNLSLEALVAYEELKMRCMTSPVLAFAEFRKTISLGDRCIQRGPRRRPLPEARGRMVSSRSLREPLVTWRGKELPLIKAGISSLEVGHHGTIP